MHILGVSSAADTVRARALYAYIFRLHLPPAYMHICSPPCVVYLDNVRGVCRISNRRVCVCVFCLCDFRNIWVARSVLLVCGVGYNMMCLGSNRAVELAEFVFN